jgi:hypothetical protein
MRCNVNATLSAPHILDIEAGTELGFEVDSAVRGEGIYHPGPLLGYMAQVPKDIESVKGWDAAGKVVYFFIMKSEF